MQEYKFAESEEGFSSKIGIFDPPKMDTAILDTERVRYYPKAAISEGSPLVFRVEPFSGGYIDGPGTTMTIDMKIVDEKNKAVTAADLVTLTNLPTSSVFSQVSLTMSGVEVNPDVGSMHAYKNYMEMLLLVDREAKTSVGEQRGYYQDSTGAVGTTDPTAAAASPNAGLLSRHALTSAGQTLTVKGGLGLDVLDQLSRYLVNGVNMYITFYQATDAFRLLAKAATTKYKLSIESMYLTVKYIKLRPEVLVRHSELLAGGKNALYPYPRTHMRNHIIPQGVNSFSVSQVLADRIPSLMIVGLVDAEGFSGSLVKSPFNFENFDVNYLSLQVGSHSVPDRPMEPDFEGDKFSEEYDAFLAVTRGQGSTFSKKDFKEGNCLFCFSIQDHLDIRDGVFPVIRKANTRLEIRFKKNLTKAVVAVIYMVTPGLYNVSESRTVGVEY